MDTLTLRDFIDERLRNDPHRWDQRPPVCAWDGAGWVWSYLRPGEYGMDGAVPTGLFKEAFVALRPRSDGRSCTVEVGYRVWRPGAKSAPAGEVIASVLVFDEARGGVRREAPGTSWFRVNLNDAILLSDQAARDFDSLPAPRPVEEYIREKAQPRKRASTLRPPRHPA